MTKFTSRTGLRPAHLLKGCRIDCDCGRGSTTLGAPMLLGAKYSKGRPLFSPVRHRGMSKPQ